MAWPCEGYAEMALRCEVEPNQFVLRVYGGSHPDNYIASALIRTYGDRGFMSSIIGERFYQAMREHLDEIMAKVGTRTLEGYMTKAHARLLRISLRGRFAVQIQDKGQCAGREMPWVVVSKGK
jgi:hypothetical protein